MATRADVAKLAGVSTSTVSYALSGARPISEATRRRIHEAMAELGYTPNALASGLAGRRSRLIALLFPALPRPVEAADLEYVVAATDAARERGYHVVLWTTDEGDLDEIRRLSRSGLVDGVLLMELRMQDARVRQLQDAGVPLALIGRTAHSEHLPFVDTDFAETARDAVRYLVELGHRAVAFVGAPERLLDLGYGAAVRIEQGVTAAAEEAGLDLLSLRCEQSVSAGRAALATVRERAPKTTAVISFTWEATVGLLQQALVDRIPVPEQLSVVSITADTHADMTLPAVTTISPPAAALGRAAAGLLIDRVEHPDRDPAHVLLKGVLVERGSCGPAPA